MAEKHENTQALPEKSPGHATVSMPDTAWFTDVINELNITRKNVLIYPDEHIQIQNSMKRSFRALNLIFSSIPKLVITITDKKLIVGNETFDPQNRRFKEFADAIRQHEIVSVVFLKGIETEELLRFLRIVATKPETIRSMGGIEKTARENSLFNIEIKTIDFSKLHLTEETNIVVDQAGKRRDADPKSVWDNLVMSLVSGSITDSEMGVDLFVANKITPTELAGFLNDQNLDSMRSIRLFENLFRISLSKIESHEEGSDQSSRHFNHVNLLLQELNPELRQQFLSVTLQHCNDESDPQKSRTIISGLQEKFVIEMMRQANDRGQEISPSLIEFTKKIANIKGLPPSSSGNTNPDALENDSAIQTKEAETLFKRESFEQYVTKEYEEMLSGLASTEQLEIVSDPERFSIEDHLETLEEKNLDIQIARVLIAFINENIELDEYLDYSKRLISICNEISISRNEDFLFLKEIFFTFKLHAIHKSNPELRSIAGICLEEIEKPLFFARAVDAFDKLGKQENNEAIDFLVLLGPKIVPEVVNLFAKYEYPENGKHLINLLSNFSEAACNEVKKRIHDPRPSYVKNLVILTREIGNKEIASYLDYLLDHKDQTIQLETLSALLKFHHPKAGNLLCRLLDASQPEIVSQAIQLSGQYKVKETAEHLVKMLKSPAITRTTIQKNEELILALGNIGNPVALPFLEKMVRTYFTLFPKTLLKMKQTIFETLDSYPDIEVSSLLKIGIRMENPKIKKICQHYLKDVQNKNKPDYHDMP
ncbi:MAG: HEAT repeat domain-containing protein [Pseudomonadota bacterium]